MSSSRDCLVIHSGVQHSADLAASLDQAGRLSALVTRLQTGIDPPWVWRTRVARGALARRTTARLADERIVRTGVVGAAAERLLGRLAPRLGIDPLVRWNGRRFANRLPSFVTDGVRCVLATDMESGPVLARLRIAAPSVALVLDVSHPVHAVSQELLRADAEELGLDPRTYDDFAEAVVDQSQDLELADRFLVASQFSASALVRLGVPESRIAVVPYAVGPTDYRIPDSRESGPLRLMALGAMSERKGMTLLLRCMEELSASGSTARLELIGREAGHYRLPDTLPDNVDHRGALPWDQVVEALSAADVLLLPSMCEGYGRTILEALAYGCTVVTTERSGGPDILAEDPSAPVVIVPVASRGSLATVIRDMEANQSDYLRPAAAVRTASRFTPARYQAALCTEVDTAIAARGRV